MNSELVQKHFVVDDEMIEDGDIQSVITPLWWSVSTYDGETEMYDALEQFTEPQKYVWAVQWYYSEVENGGHEQFFMNYAGIVWEIALEGLRVMRCDIMTEILEEAIQRIGGYPSFDWEQRWRQMQRHNVDFDDLDREFYDYDRRLEESIADYIRAHREAFHFDGDVMVPEDMAMQEDDLFIPGFSGFSGGMYSDRRSMPADYNDYDE